MSSCSCGEFTGGAAHADGVMCCKTKAQQLADVPGKATVLFAIFQLKTIVLPRQALDRHRETALKKAPFSHSAAGEGAAGAQAHAH